MWYVVAVIVSVVASYLLMPGPIKPKQSTPGGAGEVEVPQADQGVSIPVLFGTRDIKNPNCVWYGDVKASAYY